MSEHTVEMDNIGATLCYILPVRAAMNETRKIAAILIADGRARLIGYSRLVGADEDRTLARLRALRSDLIEPTIAVYHDRVVKRRRWNHCRVS